MTILQVFFTAALLTATPLLSAARAQAPAAPKVLLEMAPGAEAKLKPSSAQVSVSRSADAAAPGLVVTIQPGAENYPGISFTPEGGAWDLSAYGHVEAKVVNTGTKQSSVALRVDNAGEGESWNTEIAYLKPGEATTITTIFGYSYGKKPGYALKPNAVVRLLLFSGKSDVVQSFRIESITAAGPPGEKPPVDPNSIRTRPQNGFLMGGAVAVDAAQWTGKNVQTAPGAAQSLRATFPAGQGEQAVTFKPTIGRWDLRDYLEVRVALRNDGAAPIAPRVRVESNGGPSEWVNTSLAAGEEKEIAVPFHGGIANLNQKGSGSRVTNDAVSGVTIAADKADVERALLVKSVRGAMPPLQLPDWLGKRPPVAGDWIQTVDDDFNGPTLDATLWNVVGENYWDKQSHHSKDNVIFGNGEVRLRYEKKTGFANDDPTKKQTDWATGYLHTYDRWVQRYGYFEARMKLPKAPGLWPAFWMMPDRGIETGEQWKRQDTGNGAMEFDIMEHLTRWGPNRYNIAMHYDGYGKDHKSIGADKVYTQPDKDGYITCGLLWTPGSAIFYSQGQEVARWEDARVSNVPSILMFTLPMGGWDNNALDVAQLPADFIIDYVRVWQRKDLASPADGKKPAPAKP